VLGTGVDQVLLGTANLYTSYFTAFDFTTNTKSWVSGTIGGAVAVTHADLNGDGIPELVGLSGDGHVYVWDVAHQTLLWSGSGFNGGRAVAVADLDGDGAAEIIVLANDRVIVYAGTPLAGYLERASYAIVGSDLLVADTNGDGHPEIYVLGGALYSGSTTVYQLDNTLAAQNSYVVGAAQSIYLEQSAFGRKNLVVAVGDTTYSQTPSQLIVLDPSSGAQIWASPSLVGTVPVKSLAFYDLQGTGQLQIAFGTTVGMFVTR